MGSLMASMAYSQKISGVDFEVNGNNVEIHYDIISCSGDRNYDIRVLLGMNGRLTEITRGLSGDVENVPCGSSKRITWHVLSDREELRGPIYFAVEIFRTHAVIGNSESSNESARNNEPSHSKNRKDYRSWKADKGYVGGSIGIFAPYQDYSNMPYNPSQSGFFVNATIGYLPTLLLGVSTTVFVYSDKSGNEFDIKTWRNYGFMLGPLFSLPIGNRIKWELRPQLGYSAVSVASDLSHPDSLNSVKGGLACSLGTGLRLNIGKRTCYMLNVEYLSSPIRFDRIPIQADAGGTIGASFGIAFRFY